MILYIEKSIANSLEAKNIIQSFPKSQRVYIDNYKNIFDTPTAWKTQKSLIIAEVKNPLTLAPIFYGYPGKWYFLKNSLNCIYDCSYCYLQWIFKNNINVFFVNFKYIKKQIITQLEKTNSKTDMWFYSSDYSDNLATDNLTWFTQAFVPFFAWLKNAKLEIRTKSTNIQWLLQQQPNKNVEIAFSLSPQEIIDQYEPGTPSLQERLNAMVRLLDEWWQVGIRFMPLIGVSNYRDIYQSFLDFVCEYIAIEQIFSIFIWWLVFTKHDYTAIQKKQRHIQMLYEMTLEDDWFYRQNREVRDGLYELFYTNLKKQNVQVCFDSH